MLKKIFFLLLGLSLFLTAPVFANDPKAVGDIVARDLGYPGVGWLGHVGIWDGRRVLEVLNEDVVIQKNTLRDFKNSSPYWGARYGKGRSHHRVISAGWNQRRYNPTYTTTTWWREGGYKNVCVRRNWRGSCTKYERKMVNGRFRCDTFVNYAYKKGDNTTLVSPGRAITPRIIYYRMPKAR